MASSALYLLPPEHLSLINSLLRNGDNSVREVGRMTYPIMGSIGHRRSERAWEMCLYRHREAGAHLRVVRSGNVMADSYAVSDLTIRAIENALSEEAPVNLALLNILKATKALPGPTLMDKLAGEINAKISGTSTESSNNLSRKFDQNYI